MPLRRNSKGTAEHGDGFLLAFPHNLFYLSECITLFTKFKSNGKKKKEKMIKVKQCSLEQLNHEMGQNY